MRTLLLLIAIMVPAAAADPAVLVIHGGVGVLSIDEMKAEGLSRADFETAMADALRQGHAAWKAKANGVDAVEAAIRVMEDSPLFNAGKGAVLTRDGRAELDAAIMEGTATGRGEGKRDPRKRAGAVTGVTHVKNPISAARAVLEMDGSQHALLAGPGAEEFVLGDAVRAKYAIKRVDNQYFWTDRRLKQVRPEEKNVAAALPRERLRGTVGAVAVHQGKIVAGTSTGGLSNKWPGRIGDSPIFGAGTYADDRACGVSCTGTGELFLRHCVAHDVTARMVYAKLGVAAAARAAIDELPDEEGGVGGLIALDATGTPAFVTSAKCDGMYRGYVTADGTVYVAIFKADAWKKMP
jgi:L-asparaginase / beta-aspartyl-peptidase